LETETIYVPLLDEGTDVLRPTQAVHLGNDSYRILATPNYDPTDEHWAFAPGSVVRCVEETGEGAKILVVQELVGDSN
jgi:hypothetical protein